MEEPISAHVQSDLGDLEDIVRAGDPDMMRTHKNEVMPKRQPKFRRDRRTADSSLEGSIPGTQTVHVKTWGCSHNNSDGEYLAGQLASYGYNIGSMEDADVCVLNSCTVKNPSEEHFITDVRKAKAMGKHIVVAGCVPQGEQKHPELAGLSMLGVQQIDRVVEVVEETLKGNTIKILGQKRTASGQKDGGARLELPKIRKNALVEIIPINTGCLSQCTYCKTKAARGDLGSYPPGEIIARLRTVLQEGVREIWLTSEDLGTYGRDLKPAVRLPDLLWQMVAELPEGTMMRLGMTNPPYILEHMEEIAKVLSHPRVYSFLHIPVQAGSDSVLHDMRRQYTCAEFSQLCDFLLKHVEGGITIATDVICGFPTETDADFEETLGLVRKYKFPILYISQFYPRHGTPAAAMQQLRTQIKKSRSRKISTLFSTYKPYEGMIGSCHRVLITDRASDGVKLVGHNKHYHQILVADAEGLMGATVDVRIVQVGKFFMIGEVLGDWRAMQPLAPFVAAPTAPLQESVETILNGGERSGIEAAGAGTSSQASLAVDPTTVEAVHGEGSAIPETEAPVTSAQNVALDDPSSNGCNATKSIEPGSRHFSVLAVSFAAALVAIQLAQTLFES